MLRSTSPRIVVNRQSGRACCMNSDSLLYLLLIRVFFSLMYQISNTYTFTFQLSNFILFATFIFHAHNIILCIIYWSSRRSQIITHTYMHTCTVIFHYIITVGAILHFVQGYIQILQLIIPLGYTRKTDKGSNNLLFHTWKKSNSKDVIGYLRVLIWMCLGFR